MPMGSFGVTDTWRARPWSASHYGEACIKLDVDPVDSLVKNAMKKGDRYHNAQAGAIPGRTTRTADWIVVVKTAEPAFGWSGRV